MFNKELAESSRAGLQAAVVKYNLGQERLVKKATDLHELRDSFGRTAIAEVESFVSGLAGHPKVFDKTIEDFQLHFEDFSGVARQAVADIKSAAVNGGTGVGLGVAAGAATVGLAPTAAIAVATTFGTASTGTAIASLSGAAASKAALAWLGGGAIATGGGGMASGSALLALAGPVGWGIAGAAAIGGGFWYARKNKSIAEEADRTTVDILGGIKVLELSESFIDLLKRQTHEHVQGLRNLLAHASGSMPSNYSQLTAEQLELVGAVVNHVHSLTVLMQRTVAEYLTRQEAYDKAEGVVKRGYAAFFGLEGSKEDAEIELVRAKQALEAYCGVAQA